MSEPTEAGRGARNPRKWSSSWKAISAFTWLNRFRDSAALPGSISVLAIFVIIFFLGPPSTGAGQNNVLRMFGLLRENLPLTLPILSASLSIMLNIRQLLEPHGWIKLPTPISLGLVSFAIWYVVAAQTAPDQYIPIGTKQVLDRGFAVILVVVAFIWSAFTAVCRGIAEGTEVERRGWRWYGGQALLLFVSIVALSVPFFLFESKAAVEARLNRSLDERPFTVSIPYRDPSMTIHLARTADPVTQVVVYPQILARTATDAIAAARRRFDSSPQNRLQYPKEAPPGAAVEVSAALIVAEQEAR